MTQQTDEHDWTIPTPGETENWAEVLNSLIDDDLDQQVPEFGTAAERPDPGATELELYYATDQERLYHNAGSSWTRVTTDQAQVQDWVNDLLAGGDDITTDYDAETGQLTINTSALDTDQVQNAVADLITTGSNLSHTYDQSNDTLTIELQTPLTGVQVGTDASRSDVYADVLDANTVTADSADGLAELSDQGVVLRSQLPDLAVTETHTVADESERLALSVQEGDIAIQQDNSQSYIFLGGAASDTSNWASILTPPAPVDTVHGRTGDVTAEDGDYSLSQIGDVDPPAYIEDMWDNRPSPGTEGRRFYATDREILYRDTGVEWHPVGGTGNTTHSIPNQHVDSLSAEEVTVTDGFVYGEKIGEDSGQKSTLSVSVPNATDYRAITIVCGSLFCRVPDGDTTDTADLQFDSDTSNHSFVRQDSTSSDGVSSIELVEFSGTVIISGQIRLTLQTEEDQWTVDPAVQITQSFSDLETYADSGSYRNTIDSSISITGLEDNENQQMTVFGVR